MQLGACLAGLAIENSMLGATHALANPLTATYGIVHGQAIATMLPHVIRFNAEQMAAEYAELWAASPAALGRHQTPFEAATALSQYVADVAAEAGLSLSLSELGVTRESLPALAAAAAAQWTASFNPRAVRVDDLLTLYTQAW